MGQVLELYNSNNESTGIKQISLPAYQTSDGKIFHTQKEAEKHEATEQMIKDLVNEYQDWRHSFRVGGWTMRGVGDEFVPADNRKLEAYTRFVISQIKG